MLRDVFSATFRLLLGIACLTGLAAKGGAQSGPLTINPLQIGTLAGVGLNISPAVGDFGAANLATLGAPRQVVTNASGDVYFADNGNHEIRVIYAGGTTTASLILAENPGVTPVVGNVYPIAGILNSSGTPTNGSLAYGYSHINAPQGLVLDKDGNVYFADSSSKLWVVFVGGTYATNLITLENAQQAPTGSGAAPIPPPLPPVVGHVYWLAGTGTSGYNGDALSLATLTQVSSAVYGMSFDGSGNLYFADQNNHEIRVLNGSTGVITGVGGIATKGGKAGDAGPALSANLTNPTGVVIDGQGNIYIADKGNHAVRMIYTAGTQAAALVSLENPTISAPIAGNIYTIAGVLGSSGTGGDNVLATTSKLNSPLGIGLDRAGNIYISCNGSHVIRKINALTGLIATIAGTGSAGYSGDGGPSNVSALNGPQALDVNSNGAITFGDGGNYAIRRLGPAGALNFAATPMGSSATNLTATLTNTGSSALNFVQGVPVLSGANASEFSIATGGTCNWSSLASNASCTVLLGFRPQVAGVRTATLNISTDATTPSSALILSGNGLSASSTTLTATMSGGGPGSSATVLLTAKVSGSSLLPTGTILFKDGTTTLGNLYLSGGSTILTTNALSAGVHSLSAAYSGDANYAASTSTASLTVAAGTTPLIATSTTLTSQYSLVAEGSPITLTAKVAGTSGTPAGSVNFYDGTTLVGSASLSAGATTLVVSPAASGTHIYIAVFTGSTQHNQSTSAGVTVGVVPLPTFVFQALDGTSFSVQAGQRGKVAFSLVPFDSYTGTVSFTCGTLPTNMHCIFSPSSVAFTAGVLTGSTPVTLEITTDNSTTASTVVSSALPLGCLFLLLTSFGTKRFHGLQKFKGLFVLSLLGVITSLAGCGSSSASQANLVAIGTYTVPVSAVISVSGQNIAATTNLTIQVTK